jgi:galactokinase
LEVAVATMLEGASDVRLEPLEKARLCQRAEHRWARVPCGIMDQYAAVFGRAGHALLVDCRSTTHELIAMPPEDEAVALVANTNVHHELAAGEYAKRRAACESAARSLGLSSLRDAPPRNPREGAWMAPEEQRCIAHVHVENMLVRLVADDLKLGARGKGLPGISQEDWRPHLREIGRAMCESHRSLRDIYRVSCPELDTLVEVACSVEAVYGARMTGGGFGGCVIALVRPEAAEQLAAAWKAAYRERHGRECTIFRVKAADGAGPVELGRHGSGT